VTRIAPSKILDPVVIQEVKRRRKQNPTQKKLLDEFQAAGVARGTAVADEDRSPTDSPRGSEGGDKGSSRVKES
jgi:hypothetical protein